MHSRLLSAHILRHLSTLSESEVSTSEPLSSLSQFSMHQKYCSRQIRLARHPCYALKL